VLFRSLGLRYTSSGFNTQFNIFSAQLEDEINGFVFDNASGGFRLIISMAEAIVMVLNLKSLGAYQI